MSEQIVLWAGQPEHWQPPASDTLTVVDRGFRLAATDEGIVDVINGAPSFSQTFTITREAAINCLDRHAFRVALADRFNPQWERFSWLGRHVMKAPASSMNNGIVFSKSDPSELDVLKQIAKRKEYYGVVEEFIEGDAVEISGFRLKGETFFFPRVRQFWNQGDDIREPWTFITRYEYTQDYWWLPNFTDKALDDVKLDNSCFCVEWRVQGYKSAKVVEINPRWGDDGNGYCVTARGANPCEWVEREARRIIGV